MSPTEESTIRGVYEQLTQINRCFDNASGSAASLVYACEGCVTEALLLCEELLNDART